MDLVITGPTMAVIVEDQAGRTNALWILASQRDGAADDPDPVLVGLLGEELLDGALPFGLADGQLVRLVHAHEGKVLGQDHQFRAGVHRRLTSSSMRWGSGLPGVLSSCARGMPRATSQLSSSLTHKVPASPPG